MNVDVNKMRNLRGNHAIDSESSFVMVDGFSYFDGGKNTYSVRTINTLTNNNHSIKLPLIGAEINIEEYINGKVMSNEDIERYLRGRSEQKLEERLSRKITIKGKNLDYVFADGLDTKVLKDFSKFATSKRAKIDEVERRFDKFGLNFHEDFGIGVHYNLYKSDLDINNLVRGAIVFAYVNQNIDKIVYGDFSKRQLKNMGEKIIEEFKITKNSVLKSVKENLDKVCKGEKVDFQKYLNNLLNSNEIDVEKMVYENIVTRLNEKDDEDLKRENKNRKKEKSPKERYWDDETYPML